MNLHSSPNNAHAARPQGGAVVFIVAMTLAVLASLGLYALQSASAEVKTSGYSRQNAQSHYLSEYGTLTGVNAMSGTTGQLYLAMMRNPTQMDTSCVSLQGVDMTSASNLTKACRRMGASELSSAWQSSVPAIVAAQPNVAGSLGPYALTGDFYVEITDPSTGSADVGNRHAARPLLPAVHADGGRHHRAGSSDASLSRTSRSRRRRSTAAEGMEMSRARITAGPMRTGCQ